MLFQCLLVSNLQMQQTPKPLRTRAFGLAAFIRAFIGCKYNLYLEVCKKILSIPPCIPV